MDDPATVNQLLHLKQLGYKPDHDLTRVEAAHLIGNLRRGRGTHTTAATHHPISIPPENTPVQSTDNDAHFLANFVLKAKQAVNDATNLARADAARALAAAIQRRQEFWMDTCRDPTDRHVHSTSHSTQLWELYMKHGCCFASPTFEQTKEVLDALDEAMPSWEKNHAELFFQTLKLNFPELLRHL